MLNRRINILLSDDFLKKFTQLAKAQNISLGKLMRLAAEEKYQREATLKKRQEAIDYILTHRPAPVKGKIDYKALINEGRRR
jgi:hypothetical protein